MGLPCERARQKQASKQRQKQFENIQQEHHKEEEQHQQQQQPAPNNTFSRNKTKTSIVVTVTQQQKQSTKTVKIDADGCAPNNDNHVHRDHQQLNDSTATKFNDAFDKRTSQDLTNNIQAKAKTSKKTLPTKNSKNFKENSCCNNNVAILSQLTQLICNFSLLNYKTGSVTTSTESILSLLTLSFRNIRQTYSHHLIRHSLCLYAIASFILVLCYLTSPITAAETNHTIFE